MKIEGKLDPKTIFILEGIDSKKEAKEFSEKMEELFDNLFKGKDLTVVDVHFSFYELHEFDGKVYDLREKFLAEALHHFLVIEESTCEIKENEVHVEKEEGKLKLSFYRSTGYVSADVKVIYITYAPSLSYTNMIENLKDEGFSDDMIKEVKPILIDPKYLKSKEKVIDWLKSKAIEDVEEQIRSFQSQGLHVNKTLKEQEVVKILEGLKFMFGTAKYCKYCYISDDAVAATFLDTTLRIFQRVPITTYKFI